MPHLSFRNVLLTGSLSLFLTLATPSHGQNPHAGFYSGHVYYSLSGAVTVPESPSGVAIFTIDDQGFISGNLTGTVNDQGAVAWDANDSGFTAGMISGGVLTSSTSSSDGGVTTTLRIEAAISAGGFGAGGALTGSLQWRNPLPSEGFWNAVAFGDGTFVAVGDGGIAARSANGVDWFPLNIPLGRNLNDVAYGDNTWVVVGDNASVLTSTDLLQWTPRSIGSATPLPVEGVAFGNGAFVAVNTTHRFTSSDGGASWTNQGGNGTFDFFLGVDFLDSIFVAVGQNSSSGNFYQTSSNGSQWNSKQTLGFAAVHSVTFGNGQWVAIGNKKVHTFTNPNGASPTTLATSFNSDAIGYFNGMLISDNGHYSQNDGTTWSRDNYWDEDIADFAVGSGVIVGVGDIIQASSNGVSWTTGSRAPMGRSINRYSSHDTTSNFYAQGAIHDELSGLDTLEGDVYVRVGLGGLIEVAASDRLFREAISPTTEDLRDAERRTIGDEGAIIVGDNGTVISYTRDTDSGTSEWKLLSGITSQDLNAIAGFGSAYVVVGANATVLTSPDGVNWSGGSLPGGITQNLNNVALIGGVFFISGDDGVILRSDDSGANWTDVSIATSRDIAGVGAFNSQVAAVARDGSTFYSNDNAATWTETAFEIPFTVTDVNATGTQAVGEHGFKMSSTDRQRWAYDFPSTPQITQILQGNGNFLVMGASFAAVSPDLETWKHGALPADGFHALTYGGGRFFATSPGAAANLVVHTSVDGLNWNRKQTTQNLGVQALAYGNDVLAALANNNQIHISSDGASFSLAEEVTGAVFHDLEFINGRFLAVGAGHYATSTDGASWTDGSIGGPALRDVTFAEGLYVAVGDGGSIRTSPDALAWTARDSGVSEDLNAVRHADGVFVAVGAHNQNDYGAALLSSDDGLTWTSEFAPFAGTLHAMAVANGQLVIGGDRGALLSIPFNDADSPTFTQNPASGSVNEGATINLSATVSGAPTVTYQWFRNGQPLTNGGNVSGADAASLSISDVRPEDAGSYVLIAANDAGSRATAAADITVVLKPAVLTQPASQSVFSGANVQLSISVTGNAPFTYRWRKNGVPLMEQAPYSGTGTSTLSIDAATTAEAALYSVEVANAAGTMESHAAALTVLNSAGGTLSATLDSGFDISAAELRPSPIQSNFTTPDRFKINRMIAMDNGQVLVAGQFDYTGAGDATRSSLARFNADGTLDPTFNVPTLLNVGSPHINAATISDLAVDSSGRVLLVGDVNRVGASRDTGAGGVTTQRVLRLKTNGEHDTGFTAPNLGTSIFSIAVDSMDRVLVGGYFTAISVGNGKSHKHVSRLTTSGAFDDTFDTGDIPVGQVYFERVLFAQGDKPVFIAYPDDYASIRSFRLNSDGSVDGSFTQADFDNQWANSLEKLADDGFVAAGRFTEVNGSPRNRLAEFGPNGELSAAVIGPEPADGVYLEFRSVAKAGAGGYLASGTFDGLEADANANNVALLDSAGAHMASPAIGAGIADTLNSAVAVSPDGSIGYIGGAFTMFNGAPSQRIVKLNLTSGGGGGGTTPPQAIGVTGPTTAYEGDTVTFAVAAAGASPMSFDWRRDNQSLGAADSGQLTLGPLNLANAGDYDVVITDANGTDTSQKITLVVQKLPDQAYLQWKNDYMLTPGSDGPTDDADMDSVPNIVEYAFGSDPTTNTSGELPQATIQDDTGTEYPAVTFIRDTNVSSVTITVEAASDIGFVNMLATVETTESLGNGLERVTIRVTTPAASIDKVYFRTNVVEN